MNDPEPIVTELGIIWGRTAINLASFSQRFAEIVLTGEIHGKSCSEEWARGLVFRYKLTFSGVYAYDVRELDVCHWPHASQLDEVVDSEWLPALRLEARAWELARSPVHDYIVWTYDWVYRVAANRYALEITGAHGSDPPP